jgi:hypothetical protein
MYSNFVFHLQSSDPKHLLHKYSNSNTYIIIIIIIIIIITTTTTT